LIPGQEPYYISSHEDWYAKFYIARSYWIFAKDGS
jgi:hypothetical protein